MKLNELKAKIETGASLAGARFASPAPMQRMLPLEDSDQERVLAELGPEAAKSRLVRFGISTEKRARDGLVIFADAWEQDLPSYRKNPVVLFNHEAFGTTPRVADSVVWVEESRLLSVASFMPREISEFSFTLGEMSALRGHAASVRWEAIEYERSSDPDVLDEYPWAADLTRVELLEWSLVNLPGDTDAYAEARHAGIPTQAVADFAAQLMDEGSPARAFLEHLYASAREVPAAIVSAPEPAPIVESIDWKKEIAGALG